MLKTRVILPIVAFTLWLGAMLLPASAGDKPGAGEATVPVQTPIPARQAAPLVVNGITKAAVNAGVLTCAGRINQVATFLSSGSQSGAFLFIPAVQPDQQLFSASMEISSADIPLTYASMSIAPNQANGCGALYETVAYWPSQCTEVAATQFAGVRQAGRMGQQTAVLEVGTSARIFLLPAGGGCVSIKKEVIQ